MKEELDLSSTLLYTAYLWSSDGRRIAVSADPLLVARTIDEEIGRRKVRARHGRERFEIDVVDVRLQHLPDPALDRLGKLLAEGKTPIVPPVVVQALRAQGYHQIAKKCVITWELQHDARGRVTGCTALARVVE